jgi:hypothetical protein
VEVAEGVWQARRQAGSHAEVVAQRRVSVVAAEGQDQ